MNLTFPNNQNIMMSMKGKVYPFRDRWMVYLPLGHGKRLDIHKYLDGTPLYDKRQAERVLEHINGLIDQKKFDPTAWRKDRPYTFEKAVQTWIKLSTCSPETLFKRKRTVELYLTPFFNQYDIREIKEIQIENFLISLREKNLSPKYIYNIMGELKALLRHHHILLIFPKLTVPLPEIKWITEEQQEQVFEFIPDHHKPIFTFMKYTGCRPSEACGLLRSSVNWETKQIIIKSVIVGKRQFRERTKTNRIRTLPLIEELEEVLGKSVGASRAFPFVDLSQSQSSKRGEIPYVRDERPGLPLIYSLQFVFSFQGKPYSHHTLRHIWEDANQKAIEKYNTPKICLKNAFRHSFACQRLNDGFSYGEIQRILGHTNPKTTQRYADYLSSSLANAMKGKVVNLPMAKGNQ